jgi:hypothetical protein
MLTTGHIDHFRTFGFTVLRGFLAGRTGALPPNRQASQPVTGHRSARAQ